MAFDYTQQLAQAGNILSSFSNFNNQPQKKYEIITVNGLQEANDFKLNREESIVLVDANKDVIYIKTCDSIGKCEVKVFECKNITEKVQNSVTVNSINKSDLQKLSDDILSEVKKMLEEKDNGKLNVK